MRVYSPQSCNVLDMRVTFRCVLRALCLSVSVGTMMVGGGRVLIAMVVVVRYDTIRYDTTIAARGGAAVFDRLVVLF